MGSKPRLKQSPVLALSDSDHFVDDGREIRSVSAKGYVTYTDGTTRPPRKYERPEDLEIAIEDYFSQCKVDKRVPTISGLQLHLGVYESDALQKYSTYSRQYKSAIQKAYMRYTEYIESELMSRKTNCGGLIFVSKNRLGWRDQIEHTHSGEVKHSVIVLPAQQSVAEFNKMREVAEDATTEANS